MLGGCVGPPVRDLDRQEIMRKSNTELQPQSRDILDSDDDEKVATVADPPKADLEREVERLASALPLERLQAENRLRAAGDEGMLTAARFLDREGAQPHALIEALHFLEDIDLAAMGTEQAEEVRGILSRLLRHSDAGVRAEAARALQIQGPGLHARVFLDAIADLDRRVRWPVVRYYGDNPRELSREHRTRLARMLAARSDSAFERADMSGNTLVSRDEFVALDDSTQLEFEILDTDNSGDLTQAEWTAGWPSHVRADAIQLLQRLHRKLTPDEPPIGYNPYGPPAEQQADVDAWLAWNAALD